MNAASKGLRSPNAASPMPTASTAIVPTKLARMIPRARRAMPNALANFSKSFPSSTTSAASRDIGAGTHRHADLGLDQGRCIINSIPDHRHDASVSDQVLDPPSLVFGQQIGCDLG